MSGVADILDESRQEEQRSKRLLTTTDCARALGVTGAFIRGEIRDGRLSAMVFKADRRRARYRVDAAVFAAYMKQHWPCST